jgi:hypothetical protein
MTVAEIDRDPQAQPADRPQVIDAGKLPAVRLERRARIGRVDFDRPGTEGYSPPAAHVPEPPATIWDGEIPAPQLPQPADQPPGAIARGTGGLSHTWPSGWQPGRRERKGASDAPSLILSREPDACVSVRRVRKHCSGFRRV